MNQQKTQSNLIEDTSFMLLKDHIVNATGLDYYSNKLNTLAECISKRLLILNIATCESYLKLLNKSSDGEIELDILIRSLTIGETYFLRHMEQFDALRDIVLPAVIERRKNDRRIRIWSAGCSIGAEAYTVSILLQRSFAELLKGWEVAIYGTDINREFLARAQEGRFDEWAFRSVPADFKKSNFEQVGPKSWKILPQFQGGVSFQYHNLVTTPFPSLNNNIFAFDIILCRNVMIYFNQDLTQRMIGQFYDTLVPEGWLLVGYSEPNLAQFSQFQTQNVAGTTLYRKSDNPIVIVPTQHISEPLPPVNTQLWQAPKLPELSLPIKSEPILTINDSGNGSDIENIKDMANRGELEKAHVYCEKLLVTNQLSPLLYFYHSIILEQLGLAVASETSLKQAIYLDRGFILAHYHLGLFYQKKFNIPDSKRCFNNVLNLLIKKNPNDVVPESDGSLVIHLLDLTKMHLEVLESRKTLENKS